MLYVGPCTLFIESADYFDFVNKIRKEWHTNFTIEGPFMFWYDIEGLLNNPEQFRALLKRKQPKLVGLSNFLDFDPGSFDHVFTWDEYKSVMKKAMHSLKALDREIKCLGCIETDWVTIYPEDIPDGWDQLPVATPATPFYTKLSKEQSDIVDNANLPWKDSLRRNADGTLTLGLYMCGNPPNGPRPLTALSVYPAIGNNQYNHMVHQVKFLIEDVGMDGVYLDEFSQAWAFLSSEKGTLLRGIPTYPKNGAWDGWSAVIDPQSGKIFRKYIDCSLIGIEARVSILRYLLKRGRIVVANSYASSKEEQALRVYRFSETFNLFIHLPFLMVRNHFQSQKFLEAIWRLLLV